MVAFIKIFFTELISNRQMFLIYMYHATVYKDLLYTFLSKNTAEFAEWVKTADVLLELQ